MPLDCIDSTSFVAVVRAYYGTIDAMTRFGEDTFEVSKVDGRWVIPSWDEDGFGRGNLTGDPVTAVKIYLPSAGPDGCSAGTEDRLVPVERRIPDGRRFALHVVEEVLSGPWKLGEEGRDEQDVQGAFSPFSRVWSVKVTDGTANVSVNATTLSDRWPCDVDVRRASIERTLRELPGVSDVKITSTRQRPE